MTTDLIITITDKTTIVEMECIIKKLNRIKIEKSIDWYIEHITHWNHNNIHTFSNLLRKFEMFLKDNGAHTISHYIDLSDLPTEIFNDSNYDYKVWAVDKDGCALIGKDCNEITKLT